MKRNSNILYGIRPIIEAIQNGKTVERLFIKNGLRGDLFKELLNLAKNNNTPFQFVPMEKLNKITRKNHQGVIAYISFIEYHKIEDIIRYTFEQGKVPLILMLDRLTDVRNFGSIARTAECAGVDAIVIPDKGSAQINADAIKTSSGALNMIPVCRVKNMRQAVSYLKDSGLKIYIASEKAELSLYETSFADPMAVIMGSEDKGVSEDLIHLADCAIRIPVAGKIESLNVANAASVILYEVIRQRDTLSYG